MVKLTILRHAIAHKTVEKRIRELKTSIGSQRAEMAAYERVVEIEVADAGWFRQVDRAKTADGAQANITPQEEQFPIGEASARNGGIAQASGTEIAPVSAAIGQILWLRL